MHQSYRFAIIYFTLFGILLLLSGALLFVNKLGLTVESVTTFYLGSTTSFSQAKSNFGLLETALPHLGGMGLFIFVSGHFLLFSPKKEKNRVVLPLIALFIAALLDIGSGFLIIHGWHFFVVVKILAFLLLQGLGLYILALIFLSALKSIKKYA